MRVQQREVRLSSEQELVRDLPDRFILVLASAGSGKTEVVAQRVERLLLERHGFRVLALSYTRRAAGELRDRFNQRLGDERRRVETDTIHGFAQSLLLQYGSWLGLPPDPTIVVADADRVELLQSWRISGGFEPLEDALQQLRALDRSRAEGLDHFLAADWDAALMDSGALDYEAMLARATDLLQVEQVAGSIGRLYKHVIVDEAQNLTQSQYTLLTTLLRAGGDEISAVLVGDDKQSIVDFAGASPHFMTEFKSSYVAVERRLTRNFRSARDIAALGSRIANLLGDAHKPNEKFAARGLVEVRELPHEKEEAGLISAWVRNLLQEGLPDAALAPEEDRLIAPNEIAILGRTANSLREVEIALNFAEVSVARSIHSDDWLDSHSARTAWLLGTRRDESDISLRRLNRELGVSVRTYADIYQILRDNEPELEAFLAASTPRDFVRLLNAVKSDAEDEALQRDQVEVNTLWRSFADQTAVSEQNWRRFELFVSKWQRGDELEQGVRLQTVHKSQGREYRAVAIVGLNDGQFPDFRARTRKEVDAELRAFYVAATRASRVLLLTRARVVQTRAGAWQRAASPFLALAR